jgi:hypothetical protein
VAIGTSGQPRLQRWGTLFALALALTTLPPAIPAEAHCDSVNGPVATAARQALAAGNVNLVLPYVKAEAEGELIGAFQQALGVRGLGPEAQTLADRYFMETAVRLHRAGEGAPYTGLKEEADVSPALAAAEQALQTGALEAIYAALNEAIRHEVARQHQAVLAAREHAAREGTVAAARERVEAELAFETFVDALYEAAMGHALHTAGNPAPAGQPPSGAAATC